MWMSQLASYVQDGQFGAFIRAVYVALSAD